VRRRCALLMLLLAGCSSDVPTTGWPFDPIQFFSGRTQGDATLHIVFGGSRHIVVDGLGEPDGKGGLALIQRIAEQGKRPRVRRWVLHPAGPNRWSGTLTDAKGPVTVARTPADVSIRYRTHSGQDVAQTLERRSGRGVENHLTVSKWGIRLARLDETITKAGP